MRMQSTLTFVSALLLFTAGTSRSQMTSQSIDRHTIINARAAALGDSYVSLAYDPGGMYWNPAILTFLPRLMVTGSFAMERLTADATLYTTNVVAPIPLSADWVIGVGGMHHWFSLKASGTPLDLSWFDLYGADLAVSHLLSSSISVGVIASARSGKTPVTGTKASGYFGGYGIYYNPSPGISYGLVHQGIGTTVEYPYDSEPSLDRTRRVKMPGSVQIGLTTSFPASLGTPVVILTVASQKMLGRSGLIYKGGIEWWSFDFLALRLGYWAGPNTVAAKYGVGIRLPWFYLDYATSTSTLEPRFHQFTTTILL